MRIAAVLLFTCSLAYAGDVVVLPRNTEPLEKALDDMAQRRREREQREHERELQRRQHEHEAALAAAASTLSQTAPPFDIAALTDAGGYTLGSANGRSWKKMNQLLQFVYLSAMLDGLREHPDQTQFMCDCQFGEIMEGITRYYDSDPSYATIPISFALRLYVSKTRGESPESTAARSRGYLKMLSAPPSVVRLTQ